MLEQSYKPLTIMGLIFILCGLILVSLPFITRHLPGLDRLPWIIIWVYRKDSFYFVTSPLLIIISIASLIVHFLTGQFKVSSV